VVVECDFDPVGWLAKYSAALLSFSTDRREWWGKYQWHPLIRRARRSNLRKQLAGREQACDALVLWGSWFNPSRVESSGGLPFWPYIDQSCSPTIDEGDVAGQKSMRERLEFTAYQGQIYRDAHGIFCMSNWAREQTLAAHRLPVSKVHYVGWGPCSIDLSAEETPLNTAHPTVLFVGNDFYRKGADVLAAASGIVARSMPNVRIYIVGQHTENSRPPAHDNVIFTGPIRDKNELTRLFRTATVFCLPARFDRSPHVLVEAMSAGNPIVATNVGGIPDAVIHEKTGFLVDKENPEVLARALLAVLQHPELAREMGQAGKKVMLENFTWDVVAERILSTIAAEQRLKEP
jgi:glycosyltransferase involved in cell wall biosynthesis